MRRAGVLNGGAAEEDAAVRVRSCGRGAGEARAPRRAAEEGRDGAGRVGSCGASRVFPSACCRGSPPAVPAGRPLCVWEICAMGFGFVTSGALA